MPTISLIELPYDSGRYDERMGAGPRALIAAGLVGYLEKRGHQVAVLPVQLPEGFYTEGRALVELQRMAVPAVKAAIASRSRPIFLSGNCGTAALSAICALGSGDTGVIWFDAHGDFNTPDTSTSGFLDGMALAILTGHCWPKLAQSLEAFSPMPEKQIVQVGVRDPDDEEERRLARSGITRIRAADLAKLSEAIRNLGVRQLYVHVDVDVLDPSEGRANSYACPGGLSIQQLEDALEEIGKVSRIAAGSVTAYDPAVDHNGRIGGAIPHFVELLAR